MVTTVLSPILLYTRQRFLAEGLRSVLNASAEFQVAAVVASAEELTSIASSHESAIALLDITSGVAVTTIRELRRTTQAVLWGEPDTLEFALQAVDSGIRGIVPFSVTPAELLPILGLIRDGQPWFQQHLAQQLLCTKRVNLTRREGHLVTLLARGLSNKEIAYRLCLSTGTVKVYLSRLFGKLGVKDRFELAVYALKNLGNVPFEPLAFREEDQPGNSSSQVVGLRQFHLPSHMAGHRDYDEARLRI